MTGDPNVSIAPTGLGEPAAQTQPTAPTGLGVPAAPASLTAPDGPESERTAFDVVIVGGGPGGYGAALYGASAGLRIALVERDRVGGTCLNRGCVPAKELLETAAVWRTIGGAKEFGIEVAQPAMNFPAAQARKQKVVDQLQRGLAGLLKSRKVTSIEGTGCLLPGNRVLVYPVRGAVTAQGVAAQPDGGIHEGGFPVTELSAPNVILASGSYPVTIPGFVPDGKLIMTSDEVLDIQSVPSSVVIIGGGPIGCEFASTFADLGSSVTVLEALPQLLPGCDEDVVAVLARSFRKRGITVHTGVVVRSHEPEGGGTAVHFEQTGSDGAVTAATVRADVVVLAVGRRPYTGGLAGDGVDLGLDARGFIAVDSYQRTRTPGVWAVGDVVNSPQLAHVGFAEAVVAIKGILGEPVAPIEYTKVPLCVYSHPEVALVGLSERAARDAGYNVVAKVDPLGGNSRARILGEADGLVKVIAEQAADGSAGQILGVHMVGPWVTEQLGQAYLAVNWEATVADTAPFIQPHPTLSEAFGEAVMALTGRGLHAS